jgi:uncharacterized protein (TIGR02453 family)
MTKPIKPFHGFPKEGFAFLRGLAANNQKAWFETHKKQFVTHLLRPAQAFIIQLGERLRTLDPDIQYDTRTNGAGSLFRIYRDVRFSKDKTPYKTHLDMRFWSGETKKTSPSFFAFRIEAHGGTVLAGSWRFEKTYQHQFQQRCADPEESKKLQSILTTLEKSSYAVDGEQYKRMPAGTAKDHPAGHLLRYKGLYALSPVIPAARMTEPDLTDRVFEHCKKMAQLHLWLVEKPMPAA